MTGLPITENPATINVPFLKNQEGRAQDLAGLFEMVRTKGTVFVFNRVNWPELYPDNRSTKVAVAHDGRNLYIDFESEGEHILAETDCDLGPVANDSCVEFFVSPVPETGRYWNFEFNCIGRKNVSTRIERPNPRRLTTEELDRIITLPSVGPKPFPEQGGIHTWSLGVVIPLDLIGIRYRGDKVNMTANFYKCGAKTSSPHYLSCGKIDSERPDFHRPEFFIPFILE